MHERLIRWYRKGTGIPWAGFPITGRSITREAQILGRTTKICQYFTIKQQGLSSSMPGRCPKYEDECGTLHGLWKFGPEEKNWSLKVQEKSWKSGPMQVVVELWLHTEKVLERPSQFFEMVYCILTTARAGLDIKDFSPLASRASRFWMVLFYLPKNYRKRDTLTSADTKYNINIIMGSKHT